MVSKAQGMCGRAGGHPIAQETFGATGAQLHGPLTGRQPGFFLEGAQQVVAELFAAYMVEPDRMKPRFVQRAMLAEDVSARARVVADFIAGMTDRYAAREHELLTGLRLLG